MPVGRVCDTVCARESAESRGPHSMNAACKLPGQRVCLSVRGQTGARGGPAGQHEHQARRAGRRQRGRRGRLCVHVAAVQPRLAAHVQPADPHGAHPQGGPGAAGARPCGGVPWPGRLARAAQARADGHCMCAPRFRPQRPGSTGGQPGLARPARCLRHAVPALLCDKAPSLQAASAS